MDPPIVVIIYRDDAVRASLRFLFEAQGWAVRDFSSPAEFLTGLNPGCLVLDQNLPGMTGLELVEEIRRRGLVLPTILTTARTDPALVSRAADAGVVTIDPLMTAPLIKAVTAALRDPPPASRSAVEPSDVPDDE